MPRTHSDAAIELGRRIRAARVDKDLTLEDLGALSDMHWTNIGKIERGQVHPSVETLVRISTALNTDPSEFIVGFSTALYPKRSHRLTAAEFIAERDKRAN